MFSARPCTSQQTPRGVSWQIILLLENRAGSCERSTEERKIYDRYKVLNVIALNYTFSTVRVESEPLNEDTVSVLFPADFDKQKCWQKNLT